MKLSGKINYFFNRIVISLENSNLPFIYFVLTFIFVMVLRNFLEIFSDNLSFISWEMFAHYNLFYIVLAMILIFLFSILTKTDILKIARVILPAFIILTLVPIIDLLLSLGKGYHLTYMLPGVHDDLLLRFFTFFGDLPKSGGITPGMRIEIFLALIGAFFYFRFKKIKIIRGLIFTFFVYSFIFCYLSAPFFIIKIFEPLNLKIDFSNPFSDFYSFNHLLINFYLFLMFFLLILLLFLFNKKYFIIILKDIRFFRLIFYESMFFLGLLIGFKNLSFSFNYINIFYLFFIPISIAFAWIFSVFINNIEDCEIDKISNKERPLIKSLIPLDDYKRFGWLFFGLAFIYALAINFQTFFIILLFIGCYFLYSAPPLRLKRIPVFSKMLISINSLILVLLGFITAITITRLVLEFPISIMVFFLIPFALALNFIDIKDYEGDKKAGIKTLPVILGLKNSKILIGSFFIPAYLSIYFLIKEFYKLKELPFIFIFYLLLFGLVQFYLINKKKYEEKHVFLVSFFSLATIFYLII